ncbi:MAG: BREX system P-loop protein BrxC [Desulfuromusa sp.]|nr:BREX system P-loop protein BrxC [Desulfuromusa sp.]
MKNQEIYQRNPASRKLLNEGVANVNDRNEEVLRFELETFVCDGQYQKGLENILNTFLDNARRGAPQQPGVWVSGFYGSGKSHLVKMLQTLWCNVEFKDGATPLGVSTLPQSIQDLFTELRVEAKRHGGLHAASGTLKANDDNNSVRSALLAIIFKSVGLPAKYHLASFVMWLAEEGLLDLLREQVEKVGRIWEKEIQRLHVSEVIRQGLVKLRPQLFFDEKTCADTLRNQFPSGKDVSNDEMVQAIRQALTKDEKFPLTLIILDEVQQYIGTSAERSIDVQEAVEACSKMIGGKLMFIGTGQTAVTGTSNLKKLEGRFTQRIELSDTDVEAVIRKVILAKKPEAVKPVADVMEQNLGEISRHLSGSALAHRQDDIAHFPQDYPILPVRRRFWDNTLRVLDQTGTDSQLRNQLTMIHKAIQSNLDQPVGHVVAGDYLYFDSAVKLQQACILPRKVYEETMSGYASADAEQKLLARACGLVFLINKLIGSNTEVGLKADVDTIADLLVEDLTAGSSALRSKLPKLLDDSSLLIKVGDEYRIQTEESALWNNEFLSQQGRLTSEDHRIHAERDDRVKQRFNAQVKQRNLTHGAAKVSRDISPVFDAELPKDHDKKIYVWVRDGWSTDENSVRAEALQAGSKSPTLFVFIPKRSADDLRNALIDLKAAETTLQIRGVPNSPEGNEACAAMKTILQSAQGRVEQLLKEALAGAKVYQGGGTEIVGNSLQEMVLEAAENSLQRLYLKFASADHPGWDKVYAKAKQGAPDALVAVGDSGEVANNPVCKEVLGYVATGKTGAELRINFLESPYGWAQDAVDGALQTLLNAGLIRALDEQSRPVDPQKLERKAIGRTQFRVEATTISTKQRIAIRKVFQAVGISATSNQEHLAVTPFIDKLKILIEKSGGEAPKPESPDTTLIEQIRLAVGNEQLLQIYNRRDDLIQFIADWEKTVKLIDKRWPTWLQLQELARQSNGLQNAETYRIQVKNIEDQRMLLDDLDPIAPLVKELSQQLRDELNRLDGQYKEQHAAGMSRLQADENWQQLEPEEKNRLLAGQKLSVVFQPKVEVQTTQQILATLRILPLGQFTDQLAALSGRFNTVLEQAAELCEPKTQFISVPRRTLKTADDVDAWAEEVKMQLKSALENGPIVVR